MKASHPFLFHSQILAFLDEKFKCDTLDKNEYKLLDGNVMHRRKIITNSLYKAKKKHLEKNLF